MRTLSAFALAAAAVLPASAGQPLIGHTVTVEIVTDSNSSLPFYPAIEARHPHFRPQPAANVLRVYAEAVYQQPYRVVVRNLQPRRVGLLMAIDGRNVITGRVSFLAPTEHMYVLEPNAVGIFDGWRTSQNRVHRFVFTKADDSYAAAFGDESAMGVIALAVFPEDHPRPPVPMPYGQEAEGARPGPNAAPRFQQSTPQQKGGTFMPDAAGPAGTGYGQEAFSPSIKVPFRPSPMPLEKILVKYEWRDTLRNLGVRDQEEAYDPFDPPMNRLWDGEYAPPLRQ